MNIYLVSLKIYFFTIIIQNLPKLDNLLTKLFSSLLLALKFGELALLKKQLDAEELNEQVEEEDGESNKRFFTNWL